MPHLLFYGPPGTGKTSTILAVARKIYGDQSIMRNNCLEVRPHLPLSLCFCAPSLTPPLSSLRSSTRRTTAASTSSASRSRTLRAPACRVRQGASRPSWFRSATPAHSQFCARRLGFKLIILDEADMMTTAAQSALRRGPSLLPPSLLSSPLADSIYSSSQSSSSTRRTCASASSATTSTKSSRPSSRAAPASGASFSSRFISCSIRL